MGKTVTFKGEPIRVEKVDAGGVPGRRRSPSSPPGSAQSKEYAPQAVQAGAVVVDKSNAFRMDPAVPLVVPEINAHAVRGHQGIVACPNCTTIVTVMPLKPLHDAGRLRRVVATSYQAVSGAGVNGRRGAPRARRSRGRGARRSRPKFFQHQIAFNVIPHIDKFGAGGYTGEEMKLVNEVRKILEAPDLPISPTTVRVPVFTAHSVAVNAETEDKVTAASARASSSRRFPGLKLWDDPAQSALPDAGRRSRARTTASSGASARTSPSERGSTSGSWATSSARARRSTPCRSPSC